MSFVIMNHKSMNIFLYLLPPIFIWLQYKVTGKNLWDAFFHFFSSPGLEKQKSFFSLLSNLIGCVYSIVRYKEEFQ